MNEEKQSAAATAKELTAAGVSVTIADINLDAAKTLTAARRDPACARRCGGWTAA